MLMVVQYCVSSHCARAARNEKGVCAMPGRPGRCGPGLPQIRTCPIQASGSSSWRFAMMHPAHHRQFRYPWSLRGPGCGTRSSRQVSRPRFPNSAFPSLHRVPVTRVPRLPRYYERLRLPCTHPAALRFPSLGGTCWHACLRSVLPDVGTTAWSFGFGSPTPTFSRKCWDLPGSWRTLLCLCPGLRPRQDRPPKPFRVPV